MKRWTNVLSLLLATAGATLLAIGIFEKYKEQKELDLVEEEVSEEEPDILELSDEVAFTYEDAVKRAIEKRQQAEKEGKTEVDDRVKFVQTDKADIFVEYQNRVAYNNILSDNDYTDTDGDSKWPEAVNSKIVEIALLEDGSDRALVAKKILKCIDEDRVPQPWPEENLGRLDRITGRRYANHEYNDKHEFRYFLVDSDTGLGFLNVESNDPVYAEIRGKVMAEYTEMPKTEYFFNDPKNDIDYRIIVDHTMEGLWTPKQPDILKKEEDDGEEE